MNKNFAVIGNGFVGGSLTTVFHEKGFDVFVYDKAGKAAVGANTFIRLDDKNSHESVEWEKPFESVADLIVKCERFVSDFSRIYFVCVPTPMREDGSADLSIVEGVLSELASQPGERIAVIKSTVTPGTTANWNLKFQSTGLKIIFCPEFLTEANALDDMRNQNRIIIGGPRPHINKVKQLFQMAFPKVPLIKTSSTTAECVKYATNCFLATKIAFANEFAQICEKLDESGLDIDYDKVVEYSKFDERFGNYGWTVPGPDGHRGFGLSCFPKDINALINVAKKLGVDPKVMSAAWSKNLEVRPERDWELLIGRAISEKK